MPGPMALVKAALPLTITKIGDACHDPSLDRCQEVLDRTKTLVREELEMTVSAHM